MKHSEIEVGKVCKKIGFERFFDMIAVKVDDQIHNNGWNQYYKDVVFKVVHFYGEESLIKKPFFENEEGVFENELIKPKQ